MRLPLVVASALVLSGATCRQRLDAPRPMTSMIAPEVPAASRIDTFVRIPLAELEAQAEAVVPRSFHVDPYRMILEGTEEEPVVSAGYHVEREALSLAPVNGALLLRTTLSYWARARRYVGPVYVSGSCGLEDEPRRHFRLGVSVAARVDAAWQLRPTITMQELVATDRCEMTVAGVDVTARVQSALVEQLETELPALRDRITRTVDLRARATEAWARLQEPIELEDGTFLLVHPQTAAVTQPVLEGHFLRVGLSLEARPEIVVGQRPVAVATPLPEAGTSVAEPALSLHVPMRIDYTVIERALRDEFRLDAGGVRFPATGRRHIRPTHITLYGYGRSVVVRVEFTGYADGVLYLTGTPSLDEATQLLSLSDLEFTVESQNLLVRLAAFLRAESFRTDLRTRLRLDLRARLEETRLELTRALRRRIGALELEGAIDTLHVVAVYIDPEDRTMHAVVNATGVVHAHYIGE